MSLAAVSIVLAAASVVAASTFYSFQIRNQTRLRRMDLLFRLYATWDSLEFQESFHRIYWADLRDLDSGIAAIGGRHVGSYVFLFYDQVGALLRRGLIDFDLVDDLLGNSAVQLWEKVSSIIFEARERSDDPRLYEHFQYLYEQMARHAEPAVRA